jgi:hypothetical protein
MGAHCPAQGEGKPDVAGERAGEGTATFREARHPPMAGKSKSSLATLEGTVR